MRVLLPPSEGKASGGRGRSVAARGVAGPLRPGRIRMLDALDTLLAEPADTIAKSLLLPPAVAADAIAANRAVRSSATTPALRRYAGVVYDGLALDTLGPEVRRAAGRGTLIFSGLWGVVRGDEAVPAYRVPAKAVLPGIGVAGTFWRTQLDDVAPGLLGRGLVVDLRSGDYAAMWRPGPELRERVIAVRIVSPVAGGRHGVVSHTSKFAKGRLAAALFARVCAGDEPRTAQDVLAAWLGAGAPHGERSGPNELTLYTA